MERGRERGVEVATTTEGPVVLESGDHLTREEFHRRYEARPDIRKAELVMGVVYVTSPLNSTRHGEPHSFVIGWLTVFAAKTPGLRVTDNATVYLSEDSEVQPDVCLFWDPPRSGTAHRRPDGYIEGAPVLVVEVANSSASYDLYEKKEAYRRAGVPEYIVWAVRDGRIAWYHLRGGEYVILEPGADGVIESLVLPGLRLDVEAMLVGDTAAVLAAIGVRV
jgi:Uma2 family endonuclease